MDNSKLYYIYDYIICFFDICESEVNRSNILIKKIAGSYFLLDVTGVVNWMIEQTGLSPNQQIITKETIKSIFDKNTKEREIFPYKEFTPVRDRIPSNDESIKKLMYEINKKEQLPRLPYRED